MFETQQFRKAYTSEESQVTVEEFVLGSSSLSETQIARTLYPWKLQPLQHAMPAFIASTIIVILAVVLAVQFSWLWVMIVVISILIMAKCTKRAKFELQLLRTPLAASVVPAEDFRAKVLCNMYFADKIDKMCASVAGEQGVKVVNYLFVQTRNRQRKVIGATTNQQRQYWTTQTREAHERFTDCDAKMITGIPQVHVLDAIITHCAGFVIFNSVVTDKLHARSATLADQIIADYYNDDDIQLICTHLTNVLSDEVRDELLDDLRVYATPYVERLHTIGRDRFDTHKKALNNEKQRDNDAEFLTNAYTEALVAFNDNAALQAIGRVLPLPPK